MILNFLNLFDCVVTYCVLHLFNFEKQAQAIIKFFISYTIRPFYEL